MSLIRAVHLNTFDMRNLHNLYISYTNSVYFRANFMALLADKWL